MISLSTRNIDYSGYCQLPREIIIDDKNLCEAYQYKFDEEFRRFILNVTVYQIGNRYIGVSNEEN